MFSERRHILIYFFILVIALSCTTPDDVISRADDATTVFSPHPPDDIVSENQALAEPAVDSQLSGYGFDGDLMDSLNQHHATAIENGELADPNFVSWQAGTALLLDPTQGIYLPQTLNRSLDPSKGFELSFDFQITDLGDGDGEMYLFSTTPYNSYDAPGMLLGIRHDPSGDPDEYMVLFSYSDGDYDFIDDHPGHQETVIGNFRTDDVIRLKLSVDFETMSWSTLLNSHYTGATFETNYDYDLIKSNLRNSTWYLGWVEEQAFELEFSPDLFSSTAIIDNLGVWSPRQAGDVSILKEALTALTNHIEGSVSLSDSLLTTHLAEIYLNYPGSYAAAKAEIADFMQAYEANYPPLFSSRETVEIRSLPPESQAMLFIQQSIFDQEVVDGNMEEMAGLAYKFSAIFPGAVSDLAERELEALVPINGSYQRIPGAPVLGDPFDAKRPTGFYAAPGELVTLEIPEALVDAGLKVMLGAHDNDQSGLSETNRFVRVSKTIPLDSPTTTVVNPFGGGIYIKVPEGSDLGWFDVLISGAVRAGYFSTRTEMPSTLPEWETALETQYVPWVDMESDKYMVTLPTAHLADIGLNDPTDLMQTWDGMMDGFQFIGGRPPERARPEYFILDSRLPDDAFGTGYPQVIGDQAVPYAPFDDGIYQYVPTYVLRPEFWKSEYNTTLHERGHAAFHPTIIEETESQIHINATYIYNEQFDIPLDEAFMHSSHELLTLDGAALDWMVAHNFRHNIDMSCDPTMDELVCDEIRYQHRAHAKYIVMAELFGWDAVYNMNNVFYENWREVAERDDEEEDELWATKETVLWAASEGNGINMAPLFHFWGHAPTLELAEDLEQLPASPEIREKLLHYLDLVPSSQAAFEEDWYPLLLEAKGEVHAGRLEQSFDAYDLEDYPQQMRNQICYILIRYYPDEPAAECDQVSSLTHQVWVPYLGFDGNRSMP